MRTADFDYLLPPELIAQTPASRRDESRLLVVHRGQQTVAHKSFKDIATYLKPGDVLVLNDSKVIPARLRGTKSGSGGQIEILLVEEVGANDWWVMLRPGKRVRAGTQIQLCRLDGSLSAWHATVAEKNIEGHCRLKFTGAVNILDALGELGEMPLPPYIERAAGASHAEDVARYQTVYARAAGSVAAPTAGLHFTEPLLEQIRSLGVRVCFVTLHVGLGTFAPVKAGTLEQHVMHEERFEIDEATARAIREAKQNGGRVICVGTTSVRVLESVAAQNHGDIVATRGRTRIFIYPPYQFKVVDALVTNFHLPQSTLLMLVSAFAAPGETRGRELMLQAYARAVREGYRFFSYGDAMFIT